MGTTASTFQSSCFVCVDECQGHLLSLENSAESPVDGEEDWMGSISSAEGAWGK